MDFGLTPAQEETARRIHDDAIVIDALQGAASFAPRCDREYFQRFINGGVTAFCPTVHWLELSFVDAARTIYEWQANFTKYSDIIVPARTAEEIVAARASGRVAVLMGTQDGGVIGHDAGLLSVLHTLGIRMFTLSSHNNRSLLADGAFERTDAGLSNLGVQAVKECNRLGVVIDLTHVGTASALDAIDVSEHPCVFSHSGCYALSDTRRNETDEEIRALAERGGVIGICVLPGCLRRQGLKPVEQMDVNDYLDHVDYVVNLVGIDHVGIGSDFHPFGLRDAIEVGITRQWLGLRKSQFATPAKYEGFAEEAPVDKDLARIYPRGIEDISKANNITRGLVARGYGEAETRKILGGNFLRVFREVFGQ